METLLILEKRLRLEEGVGGEIAGSITLPFELRQKARQRARLESGRPIGIRLSRGTIMRHGDLLCASSGEIVQVRAACERVTNAYCDDAVLIARAAYHLGNRHVHVQIESGWIRYLRDHVLDHMLESLGLVVMHAEEPFEPEAGAYTHGHGH